MRRRLTTTIQVLRRLAEQSKDRHGNPTGPVFDDPEEIAVYGIAPASSSEDAATQAQPFAVRTGWDVYAPLELRISPHDRVVIPDGTEDGILTEVFGEPARWDHNPHRSRLRQGGVIVHLERTTG